MSQLRITTEFVRPRCRRVKMARRVPEASRRTFGTRALKCLPVRRDSDALEDDCDALTAADAGRGEAVATASALEFVERRQHEPRARRAERVAEGDCAAVDVRLRAVEAEFTFDGEVLAGEGLVDFDEINLFELQTCLLKCLADGGHGADAHQVGLDARVGPTDDAAQRL